MWKKWFLFYIIIAMGIGRLYPQKIKECEFCGSFYPREGAVLNSFIDEVFEEVKPLSFKEEVLGVISPHAGYIYSGKVAAYSYKIFTERPFETVIILAPSHRYYFRGVSIYPQGYFHIPLGRFAVDKDLAAEFSSLDFVQFEPKYFNAEHSIEVQLPFLFKVLPQAKIVPILFGQVDFQSLERLADKLLEIAQKRKFLLVVSTDLSHFLTYKEANNLDGQTISLIKEKDAQGLFLTLGEGGGRACGIFGLITLLIYAQKLNARIEILKYLNSGDTAGDKDRVVGYLSAVMLKDH